VRACKTAAEERAVINKECADIRSSIREEAPQFRHRNVAKLLYIHMLGYPTSWGHMECLKLISSSFYSDKRIGYLGLMVLMDETQEVLTLVTNHMKNDLNNPNQFIGGLALTALGNISSSGIARDLAPEVEKLLSHSNPYLRKKAALAAIRILRKCPDLMENFVPRIRALLNERNHGVLLTGVTLMQELCETDPHNIEYFRRLVPTLVRILKNLVMSGYAPEYDVSGITDPFLQVKLLRLLKILGKEDSESSDVMNDILAQVATNTDHARNVGNAILYECVNTIMSIEAEGGLRVLAINVLGRFLQNRDNNIRYVALNTLSKVVNADLEAVQRHRNTIVDCLKDPDVSIRKRALDLIYALVNESNIKILAHELINFLQTASLEFRGELTAKLCNVTEKYAPNKRWQVDTIIRVMSIAGPHVPEEISASLIALIAGSPELQPYAVQKMYLSLLTEFSQNVLAQVASWCIGEFGDMLVNPRDPVPDAEPLKVTENDVIDILEKVMRFPSSETQTKQYALTALMKLTTRFSSSQSRIRELINAFRSAIEVEVQQRANEYTKLAGFPGVVPKLFERIPVSENQEKVTPTPAPVANRSSGASIIDWDVGAPSNPTTAPSTAPSQAPTTMNILEELFGSGPMSSAPVQTPTSGPGLDLNSLLGGPSPSLVNPMTMSPNLMSSPMTPMNTTGPTSAPITPTNGTNSFVGYNKNGLVAKIEHQRQENQPNVVALNIIFTNSTPTPLVNFEFKAAVPKYLKLQVNPASGNVVPPNNSGRVTQSLKLLNTLHGEKSMVLKMKLDYQQNGSPVSEIVDVNIP